MRGIRYEAQGVQGHPGRQGNGAPGQGSHRCGGTSRTAAGYLVCYNASVLLYGVVFGPGAAAVTRRSEMMERVRPIEVHKECRRCGKRYPMSEERCICGGWLYVTWLCRSTYPHKTGGDTDGQGSADSALRDESGD